jgi:hypothetical protein
MLKRHKTAQKTQKKLKFMKDICWKRLVMAMILASFSVGAQAATVALWDGPYSYGIGSAFTALTIPSLNGSYASAATETINGQTGFQTFCLQTGVDVDPGSGSYPAVTYNYSLSLATTPDGFPLKEGTAWLYSQFAQGTLNNFDYSNLGTSLTPGSSASRAIDNGALQSAIWYLQGGQTWPGYVPGGIGNIYYDDAENYFGTVSALDADATLSTDFGVNVMNLTDANGAPAQNQLIYLNSAVPDHATTWELLAGSLAALTIFTHRSHVIAAQAASHDR